MRWKLKNFMRDPHCADEGFELGGKDVPLLHMRQVPAFGYDDDLRAGNELLIGKRIVLWKDAIVFAPDEQRRYFDPMQPFAQVRIMVARLPRELGGRHPILERGILELRPLRAGDDCLHELLIVEQIADALLLIGQKSIDLRDAIDVDTGGANQGYRG